MSHFSGEGGYIGLVGDLHPLPYLQGQRVRPQEKVVLRERLVEAPDQDGQNVHPQFPGRQESASVESAYTAVNGTRAFGENDHRIAFGHHFLYMLTVHGKPPGGREIAGFADHGPIERELPNPVVGHKDELGLQGYEGQHIQVALVVADVYSRLGEILSVRILKGITATGYQVDGPGGNAPHNLVVRRSLREEQRQQRQQGHPDNHLEHNVNRGQHSSNRKRILAGLAMLEMKPAVYDRRQVASHGHHGNHANHRYQPQRTQRRMLGKSQNANADEHDNGAEHHGIAVGMENLLPRLKLIFQPLGNENAVIISHSKDEGGQDNIHDIELQARQAHDSPDPYPAHCQRQEGHQRKFQRPEADPEEDKDNQTANQADGVKILR